jgi:Fe-S-cluster-containing dehydrogenase component
MNASLEAYAANLIEAFTNPNHRRRGKKQGSSRIPRSASGCKACEVACKQWNQLPANGFHSTGYSYDNTVALSDTTWRHVAFVDQFDETGNGARWLMMSDVCKHCQLAPCEEVCPTGTLIYNEFGNVYVQQDICNGCANCVAVCPFGVLDRNQEDGRAHKCTLCYDRLKDNLVPACANSLFSFAAAIGLPAASAILFRNEGM